MEIDVTDHDHSTHVSDTPPPALSVTPDGQTLVLYAENYAPGVYHRATITRLPDGNIDIDANQEFGWTLSPEDATALAWFLLTRNA